MKDYKDGVKIFRLSGFWCGFCGYHVRLTYYFAPEAYMLLFPVMVATLAIFIFVIRQARRGNPQIWNTALSFYDSNDKNSLSHMEVSSYYRASSMFNFSPTTGRPWVSPGKGSFSASTRDYFAPPSPVKLRNSVGSSIFGGGRSGVGAFASPTFSQTQRSPSPGVTGFQSDVFKGFDIVTGGSLGDDDLWIPIKR